MKKPDWKNLNKRRLLGVGLSFLGILTLFTPFLIGEWIISLLGILFVLGGVFSIGENIRLSDESTSYLTYVTGLITVLLGFILFFSPNFVLAGLVIIVTIFFLFDGVSKIYYALQATQKERAWNIFNGIFNIILGLTIWYFITANLGVLALGVFLGLRLLVEGWTMFFLPEKGLRNPNEPINFSEHPDYKLYLEPNDVIQHIQEERYADHSTTLYQHIVFSSTFLLIFFAIHVTRTDARWSLLGFITPFSALIGDILMAILVAILLVIPIRLLWRKFTRPFERFAWRRYIRLHEQNEELTFGEQALLFWITQRLAFALQMRDIRGSLNYAFWRILRFGIPLTAVFIAINSIWGFSWYFNSENWASAVWQELNKSRVDGWRQKMAEKVEQAAFAKGIPTEKVFAIEPNGVNDSDDFSFIVIGDTGEGDQSQLSLAEQYVELGKREDIKFLILSSDVVYPDGKMRDYEKNFYLPFKGFQKPIYAIPGNHDWFDANEGFNANFFEPDSAKLALQARLQYDLNTDEIKANEHFSEIVEEAERLRKLYRIQNGLQRAPFFEMHTEGFSLITVDTGILRTLDEKQFSWLRSALQRAEGNFKFMILGHPFYAAGHSQIVEDKEFDKLYQLLKTAKVDIIMAGDTHDFEYYKEKIGDSEEIRHFVNGGGGAYLSIGTALDFPKNPPTEDFAFYPRTDQLYEKLDRETPTWKSPALYWIKYLNGFPLTTETLGGIFDFNNAPFFQSFMEIKVERSKNQVRLLLYGANGGLHWKDIQVDGKTKPVDKSDEDLVEFIVPLRK